MEEKIVFMKAEGTKIELESGKKYLKMTEEERQKANKMFTECVIQGNNNTELLYELYINGKTDGFTIIGEISEEIFQRHDKLCNLNTINEINVLFPDIPQALTNNIGHYNLGPIWLFSHDIVKGYEIEYTTNKFFKFNIEDYKKNDKVAPLNKYVFDKIVNSFKKIYLCLSVCPNSKLSACFIEDCLGLTIRKNYEEPTVSLLVNLIPLTVPQLAEFLNLSNVQIYKLKDGTSDLKLSHYCKIKQAFPFLPYEAFEQAISRR